MKNVRFKLIRDQAALTVSYPSIMLDHFVTLLVLHFLDCIDKSCKPVNHDWVC